MLDRKPLPIWFWIVLPIILFLGASFVYLTTINYFYGDYRITKMYISSIDPEGIKYCDSCLWIEFDEGCNRQKLYYFENQHELDSRLKVGMPVNIYYKPNGIIKHVEPTWRYYYKCS